MGPILWMNTILLILQYYWYSIINLVGFFLAKSWKLKQISHHVIICSYGHMVCRYVSTYVRTLAMAFSSACFLVASDFALITAALVSLLILFAFSFGVSTIASATTPLSGAAFPIVGESRTVSTLCAAVVGLNRGHSHGHGQARKYIPVHFAKKKKTAEERKTPPYIRGYGVQMYTVNRCIYICFSMLYIH